jgi:hypothetical protein
MEKIKGNIMANIKVNKIIGVFLIMTILFAFVPYTIKQFNNSYGPLSGLGILIIPSILGAAAFLVTGVLSFISVVHYPKVTSSLYVVALILIVFNIFSSFVGGYHISNTLFSLIAMTFIILSIKTPKDNYLLVVNTCGLAILLKTVDYLMI